MKKRGAKAVVLALDPTSPRTVSKRSTATRVSPLPRHGDPWIDRHFIQYLTENRASERGESSSCTVRNPIWPLAANGGKRAIRQYVFSSFLRSSHTCLFLCLLDMVVIGPSGRPFSLLWPTGRSQILPGSRRRVDLLMWRLRPRAQLLAREKHKADAKRRVCGEITVHAEVETQEVTRCEAREKETPLLTAYNLPICPGSQSDHGGTCTCARVFSARAKCRALRRQERSEDGICLNEMCFSCGNWVL